MAWLPLITLIIQHVLMLLRALANPETVTMVIKTADGKTETLPCNVKRVRRFGVDSANITSNYMSKGVPITSAVIYIGKQQFAKAKFKRNDQVLYTSGPIILGDTF